MQMRLKALSNLQAELYVLQTVLVWMRFCSNLACISSKISFICILSCSILDFIILTSFCHCHCVWFFACQILYSVILYFNTVCYFIPDFNWCCFVKTPKERDWGTSSQTTGLSNCYNRFCYFMESIETCFKKCWPVLTFPSSTPFQDSHSEHWEEEILNLRNTLLQVWRCLFDDLF